MKKYLCFLTLLAALLASHRAAAQTSGRDCFGPFLQDGNLASERYDFNAALNFFQAAQECRDLSIMEATLIDSMVDRAQFQLDSALTAAKIQAKVNEITGQAYKFAETNPTLAVRLAHEACRISHNGSELAVTIRRQLLEKKGATFYNFNLDCGCDVVSVDVSPDSRFVAIGCYSNGAVKLFDRETGELQELGRHKGDSYSTGATMAYRVLFSPQGDRLLSASTDGTVKLWNLEDGAYKLLKTYEHDDDVGGVAFSPTGDSILTASKNTAYLWHARRSNYGLIRTYEMPDEVRGLDFSPDGKAAVCGLKNFIARKWLLQDENKVTDFTGHAQAVALVQFSPDGSLLLTGSADRTAKLWDVDSGAELRSYDGHAEQLFSIDFSSDGQYVMTGSLDNTIKIWDRNGQCRLTLPCSKSFFGAAAFSPDDAFIAAGDFGQHVRLWPVDFEALTNNLPHTDNISALAVAPDNSVILTGSTDHTAKLWEVESAQVLWTFQAEDEVVAADWALNGNHFILGLWNGTVHVFDRNRTLLGTFKRQHTSSVMAAAMSPDGSRYITGGRDGVAKLWKLDGPNKSNHFNTVRHKKEVSTVAWSPDGKLVATGSWDGTVKVGPWGNGSAMKPITLPGAVQDVRFSPNSRQLLICGAGGTAKLYTVEGKEVFSFQHRANMTVTAGEFSVTGDTIFTGTAGGWLRLWVRGRKEDVDSEAAHSGGISAIRIVGNSGRLISAGTEGRARLYEYDFTSQRIYRGHVDDINYGAATPDGNGFVTTSTDRSIKHWSLNNRAFNTMASKGNLITAFTPLPPDGEQVLVGCISQKKGLLYRHDLNNSDKPVEVARFPGAITAVDCSANGSRFVACDSLGNVRVFDTKKNTLLKSRTLPGPAYDARISSTGQYVVVGTGAPDDETLPYIYLWDWERDSILKKLPHIWDVRSVAISPSDDYLASGDVSGFIKLWRVSDGALIKVSSNEKDTIQHLAFSPNSAYLLTVDDTGVARLWDASEATEAEHCLLEFSLEEDEIVDADFISNDSIVVFGKRLGGVIMPNRLEQLDQEYSNIAQLSPSQRNEFKIEYDTEVCLASTNSQEVLECGRYFAGRYEDTENENDFQKADLIYQRLLELAPEDEAALVSVHDLYSQKIDVLTNGSVHSEMVAWSARRVNIAKRLYQLDSLSEDNREKLYSAHWNYSWYLILTADFAQAFASARAGLAVKSDNKEQNGIISNQLLAQLMLADTEAKYQAVKQAYRQHLADPWVDDRFPTFREVFDDDFKELLKVQTSLPEAQRRNIDRIRAEVLTVR